MNEILKSAGDKWNVTKDQFIELCKKVQAKVEEPPKSEGGDDLGRFGKVFY